MDFWSQIKAVRLFEQGTIFISGVISVVRNGFHIRYFHRVEVSIKKLFQISTLVPLKDSHYVCNARNEQGCQGRYYSTKQPLNEKVLWEISKSHLKKNSNSGDII